MKNFEKLTSGASTKHPRVGEILVVPHTTDLFPFPTAYELAIVSV